MTLLASLEDFAATRGVAFDPTDLQAIIALEGASSTVRRKTQQVFDYAVDDEVYLNGTGVQEVLLPQLPVHGVTEVGLLAVDFTETLDEEWILADHGILYRKYRWRKGVRNVRVVYDHGYILPGEEAVEGIPLLPAELSLVTMQLAMRSRVFAATEGQTVDAKQLGSFRVEYGNPSTEDISLTAFEQDILDGYRQVSGA